MQKTLLLHVITIVFAYGLALAVTGARELRVVGGKDVNITEIPYQLAMEYSGSPFCSGAIISEIFAVTASHCMERYNPSVVAIRVGTSKRAAGGETITIRNFTRSPKFNINQLDYDVAVIEFAEPIRFDHFRRAVEIGTRMPEPGERVTVSGWGKTSEMGAVAGNLQSVKVRIVDRDFCRDRYKNMVNITDRMFCAGDEGQDACGGDSGAPATSSGKLVGIVSWGYGCARGTHPGVYTNLLDPEIRNFIFTTTGI